MKIGSLESKSAARGALKGLNQNIDIHFLSFSPTL